MSSHTLPPIQCATNTTTFTDATLTADVTKVRKTHIDELRTSISNELTRRGLSSASWTDSTITANSTKIRKTHIDELRTQIENIHSGNGQSGYCPGDTVTISWTDSTITANSTKPRNVHITEMRTTLNSLKSGCICETEQCKYCADCGYMYYISCGHCACQDRCGGDDHPCPEHWVYLCGSVNGVGTQQYPYKSWDGYTSASWDGTVPWAWGDGIPGAAINWGAGWGSPAWSCKCNPYTWYA